MSFQYDGVLVQETSESPAIALFSAPADEIDSWAGIPQRRRIENTTGSVESMGFQREESSSRISEIARFMSEPKNVIQNPLLAAVQVNNEVTVEVLESPICRITIEPRNLEALSLRELLVEVESNLVRRMPALAARPVDEEMLTQLRQEFAPTSNEEPGPDQAEPSSEEEESDTQTLPLGSGPDAATGLFEDETQVVDFFDETKARIALLTELGPDSEGLTAVGGFSRAFLEGLIRPVVLVDGQHRLRGALQAVDDVVASDAGTEQIAAAIDQGSDPASAEKSVRELADRHLPVSLLLSDDPSEHVFQFVVVNQKATPMSPALLGTIVSTSLSTEELEPIAARLLDAGIELEDSRAIAFLTRSPDSPYRGLVSTGVRGDRPGALPWSVLRKLVSIVRVS